MNRLLRLSTIAPGAIVVLATIALSSGTFRAVPFVLSGLTVTMSLWLLHRFRNSDELQKPANATTADDQNQLIVNFAPDIRRYLKDIAGGVDDAMPEDLSWPQRKRISKVRDNLEQLDDVLNNILDFAAIDAGTLRLHPTQFALRDTLRDLFAPYVQQARQQDRSISRFLQSRVPDGLNGDVGRLCSVLQQLLDRIGADSTTQDIVLNVSVAERDDKRVTIEFAIHGGETEQVAPTVETYLANHDNTDRSLDSGSVDLRLALTIHVTALLGRRLTVIRKTDRPTQLSFAAHFDVLSEAPRSFAGRTTIGRSSVGLIPDLSVLIVHSPDNEREDLINVLNRWKADITCVDNGKEMWSVLKQTQSSFGLIIVATELSDVSGLSACQALQLDQRTASIPRLLLVEEGDDTATSQNGGVAVAELLTKPVTTASIAKKMLSTVLGKGRFRQMRTGIDAAEKYLRSLIPPPMTEPLQIDWRYVAAADLAGDALGYQWIDDDHCALYVIDICGHGMDASLLSVSVLNVLKSMSLPDTDFRIPEQVLTELNRKFPMESHGDRCFTAWYGVYVPATRELRWSGGGHPPALLLDCSTEAVAIRELQSDGPMLGMIPDTPFTGSSCVVPDDTRLLAYTDGVYELESPVDGFGTFEDFMAFTKAAARKDSLLDDLWNRARTVNGDESLDDDFTVMDVRF